MPRQAPRTDEAEFERASASPWAFRNLPPLAQIWWGMYLGLGWFGAAVAWSGQTGDRGRMTGLGWLLTVAGVFSARRDLPLLGCKLLVLGGCALIILGDLVPVANLLVAILRGRVAL